MPPCRQPNSCSSPRSTVPEAAASHRLRGLAGLALAATLFCTAVALVATLRQLASARTHLRQTERALGQAVHEAGHDPLTGLPNRRNGLARLTDSAPEMVGLLDLDNFKQVNDRYGHHVGDQLLQAVAAGLTAAHGDDGMVARLAGDEFLILWDRRPRDPMGAARRLLEGICVPVVLDGHALTPGASIGLALHGTDLTGEALIASADCAMYQAKQAGGVRLYGQSVPTENPRRRSMRHRSAYEHVVHRAGVGAATWSPVLDSSMGHLDRAATGSTATAREAG